MGRNVADRYRGLPPRTPEMLFQVVRKFYRGAVSHIELIETKKQEVLLAWQQYRQDGNPAPLAASLHTLFCEFHFYVTCWLQLDLALYRLARMEETRRFAQVREAYLPVLERHVAVRRELDATEACVNLQFERFAPQMACVPDDRYCFGEILFSVDGESVAQLHELYEAIMKEKESPTPRLLR